MLSADTQQIIEETAAQGLAAGLECDGLTRVLHSLLVKHQVEHQVVIGYVATAGRRSPIHYWIILADGTYIDYTCRLWLGDELTIPHGIFQSAEHPRVTYTGQPIEMDILPPAQIQLFLTPFPAELLKLLKPPYQG